MFFTCYDGLKKEGLEVNGDVAHGVEEDSGHIDGEDVTEKPPAEHHQHPHPAPVPVGVLLHHCAPHKVLGQLDWAQIL